MSAPHVNEEQEEQEGGGGAGAQAARTAAASHARARVVGAGGEGAAAAELTELVQPQAEQALTTAAEVAGLWHWINQAETCIKAFHYQKIPALAGQVAAAAQRAEAAEREAAKLRVEVVELHGRVGTLEAERVELRTRQGGWVGGCGGQACCRCLRHRSGWRARAPPRGLSAMQASADSLWVAGLCPSVHRGRWCC